MKKKQTPSPRKGVPSKMKGRKMPPRAQIVRLARIASLLKRNSCPTAEKLLKEYRDIELVEGKTIRAKYSLRTVYRDIDLLRSDFECPIAFDRANKTYYLEDPKWILDKIAESPLNDHGGNENGKRLRNIGDDFHLIRVSHKG